MTLLDIVVYGSAVNASVLVWVQWQQHRDRRQHLRTVQQVYELAKL